MIARLPFISTALTLAALAALAAPAKAGRGKITAEDRQWWAFQPINDPAVPAGGQHQVDAFLRQKLSAAGLDFAPLASRATLLRRLTFDLTGLPPSLEQIAAFEADSTPGGWERLIDSLLASPQYGERWAHHWLDLVRYAESDGYKADDYRPEAWRYRDWVIRALNEDMGYDTFVQQQLAGDELFPGDPAALIATGYLRCGIYEYNNRDTVGQRAAILNDLTDTTADVFLGLGLQCARCHDHKFDPLLQKDYYQLQAFFSPLRFTEKQVAATPAAQQEYARRMGQWETATASIRAQIEAIEQPTRDRARDEAATKFPPETRAILDMPADRRTPLEVRLHDLAWRQVTYEWARLEGKIKGEDKARLSLLRQQLAGFAADKPAALPQVYAAEETSPAAPPVLIPQKEQLGAIEPGFPVILGAGAPEITPGQSTGRRSALALWMTSRKNPLTARVIVNRVWQQHFGRGLSGTTSDLGRLGELPSHPELLDWLAARFMADGWSFKKLHRLILTSDAWRQGTASPQAERARLADPENRLLWRWNTRRLDAEQIRDAIHSVTGELDHTSSGPGVDLTKPRRSIFVKFLRNVRDPLAEIFDGPQRFQSTPQRDTTTTPLQSLHLANSRKLMDRAHAMGARLLQTHTADDPDALISAAWLLTTGAPPDDATRGEARAFIHQRTSEEQSVIPAGSELITEPVPQREGRGLLLSPGSRQESIHLLKDAVLLPSVDFTVEAIILLRSVYDDARVRTVISQWDGDKARPGWLLGVTGKASRRAPLQLVMQLSGANSDGLSIEEPVFSGLTLQADRSYSISASVHMAPGGSVTFTAKDLANEDEPAQASTVPHGMASLSQQALAPLVIGDSSGTVRRQWDGLIDEIRLRHGAANTNSLAQKSPPPDTIACWDFEAAAPRRNLISGRDDLLLPAIPRTTARATAVTDLCHALLSSSAFLYVP